MNDRPLSREQNTRLGRVMVWLALLVLLAGAGGGLALRLRAMQSAHPGISPTVPLAADKSYGVNADLTPYSAQDLDRTLDQMQELGLSWVRQPFRWSEIETQRGQFNWEKWDRVVEATGARGFKLIAVLDTSPPWARPSDSSPFTPPAELADFGNFARALAQRYADHLDHYQIWDEPNLSAHWGDHFVDPAAYARLLREGAVNIRAEDSDAVILTAGLAPTLENGPLNLNEPDFLNALYRTNASPWFDVVAAQPYGFKEGPQAPADQAALNFARVEILRQTMAAHGDGDKPVWATAFGWSALPSDWKGQPSPWPSLTPDRQATYTVQAIERARANWPWLGPMLFAAWDQESLPPDDPRQGLALVSGEEHLPQATTFAKAQERLAKLATVGTYPADHGSGQYTGDWRFSPAGADVPRHEPAQLAIPFEGTRLDLMVRRGDYRAFLYVTIDGQASNLLPQQEGRSYVVLYDPLEEEDSITLARYLADAPHTAVIEAEGGWYQWPIIGWRVSREGDARAIERTLLMIGTLAIVCAGGLAYSLYRTPSQQIRQVVGRIEGLNNRYLALGTPLHLVALGGAAAAFYFAPGTLPSLALMGLFFLTILPRPNLGLALTAFSLPFFLLPKSLIGRTISMTEVTLLLVALACIVRRLGQRLGQPTHTDRSTHWLDGIAWGLTAVGLAAFTLTMVPAASRGPLAAADWPAMTLMLLPLAGVLAAIAENREVPANSLDLAVMALVGLSFVATLAAENFGVSFLDFHLVVWDGAAFYAFVRLIPNSANLRRQQGKEPNRQPPTFNLHLIDGLVLGTTLMALYAIYQFFFTDQAITAEGVHRALGVYGSPNNLALLLDRVAPILVAVVAFSRARSRRLLYGLALIPTLVALVLTFSRGALLLGMPAAILFIGLAQGGRVLWATLGVLLAGGLGMLPLLGTERFRSLLDTSAGTGFFRLRLWQSAWAMLRDHPWLGMGLDNFLYQYRTRYILPDAWQEPNLSHPHNILLDFGTRLGLGGIAILLWMQLAFWRIAARLYRRLAVGEGRALVLGLMASMVATLAHGLVDHSFFLVDLAFIFFLTLGVVGRLEARDWRLEIGDWGIGDSLRL